MSNLETRAHWCLRCMAPQSGCACANPLLTVKGAYEERISALEEQNRIMREALVEIEAHSDDSSDWRGYINMVSREALAKVKQ